MFVPATGKWGYMEANSTWNGVVGMVSRGEAEAGVCDIALNAGRVGVISYSMQVATFQYVIEPPTCVCNYVPTFKSN